MKRIILGTAGHIDHGKTTFVKALTGIDTDRLKEEKERGITIELGFAHFFLPNGTLVGIVDVPGHEKFVKNMVAGASGIDLVALTVAADEGVMPQTEEHLEICELLGIRYGIIVITKIDLVDEEILELVKEDIKEHVKGTFLENAPVVEVCSVTGEGIDKFIKVLEEMSYKIPERKESSIFRLPIDRVFTIKGFGTVVTGTTISGRIRKGDEVTVYPVEIDCKIRAIQVHKKEVNEVGPSTRTALSLQGVEKDEIERGYVVASKDSMKPSYMLDVFLELLKSSPKPLKNREKVRFHVGTAEIMGSVVLLDRESLVQGDSCYAQIRLEEPVSALRGDRFVIRSYSPVRTIGGGQILHPFPKKRKRKFSKEILPKLEDIHRGKRSDMISAFVFLEGYDGISKKMLSFLTNLEKEDLEKELKELLSKKEIFQFEQSFIHSLFFEKLKDELLEIVKRYHSENPIKIGIPKEELRSKLKKIKDVRLFNLAVEELLDEGKIEIQAENIKLKGYEPILTEKQKILLEKIERLYRESGFSPPYLREIKERYPDLDEELIEYLVWKGDLVKIKEDFYLHSEALKRLIGMVEDFFKEKSEMSVQDFKQMTNTTRKYCIPLLEYLDKSQITIRIGDKRKLRRKG